MSSSLSNRIMKIAQDHSRKVKECGATLAQMIELWINGDVEEAKKRYELLIEIEKNADIIKSRLTTEIAEADMLGLIGKDTDFSSLILKTDQIIDYSEGTGQRLTFCTWKELPPVVKDKAIALSEVILESTMLVRDAFYALENNPDKILKICDDIDAKESKSDKIFRELQRILYSDQLKDVDLRLILPFLDAMEHLEDMGDIAESVAARLKIIYIARFGSK
ncbi:MAG: DUF47 family protein [Promethearchaeota archaeon]